MKKQPPQVLLVDDNPADVELVCEASAGGGYRCNIHNEVDGEKTLAYMRRVLEGREEAPGLILLDLNLPGKSGLEVLAELKGDPKWCAIPIVVFSSSQCQRDIVGCYAAGANCYVSKPGDLNEFFAAVQAIEKFWFESAQLPEEGKDGIACKRASG